MVHFRSSHRIAQPSRFARYVWASRGATRRTQVQVQVGHSAEPQVRLGGPGSRVPDVELTRHPEVVVGTPGRLLALEDAVWGGVTKKESMPM